jgi:hypothetical protein
MLSGSRATSPVDSNHSGDTKVYEVTDSEGDKVQEVPAESAESQLSMCHMGIRENAHAAHLLSERLGKDWISPIYVFFNRVPRIEHIDGRCVHVFMCAASHCKGRNGRDVHHFLDTGDAKSTSGLRRHAKMCWGDEAVCAADETKDLEGACEVLKKSGVKRNGSITSAFARIYKDKVTYLHRQYTYTETRYVVIYIYTRNLTYERHPGLKSFAG